MTPKNREEAIRIVVNAAADHLTGGTGLDLFQILDAAGLAIVPKEPNEDMRSLAWYRATKENPVLEASGTSRDLMEAYRAMLDASPFNDKG